MTTKQLRSIFTGCAPVEMRESLDSIGLSVAGSMYMFGILPVPYDEEWGQRMTKSICDNMAKKRLMPEKKLERLREYVAFVESHEQRVVMRRKFPFENISDAEMGQLIHAAAIQKAYPDKSSPFLRDNFPILEEYANYAVCRRGIDTLVTSMQDYGYTFQELCDIVQECTILRDTYPSMNEGIPTYVIAKEILARPIGSEEWTFR